MMMKLLRPALAVVFLATVQLYAAIPPAENLLPSDTLAFFSVPDCAAARTAAKTWPGWMFWGDPAMKPFRDKLVARWNDQFITPLERDLGVKTSDFADLPQGQFTLAVSANGTGGRDDAPPGLLLLLDAKGKSDLLKTNLALLIKKWTDAGRLLRTEQIHGLTFTVVPLSSNDLAGILPKKTPVAELGKEPPKPAKPGEIYFAQFQTLLVAGNSPKAVEPVAAHLTGGSEPAIADNAAFAADKVSQFRDSPQYCGWFNGKGFFNLVAQSPPSNDQEDSPSPLPNISVVKAFSALGLNSVRSISFALHDTREGSAFTLHVAAPESERAGLLKILALPPKDAGVPPFVPADAVKFTRIRLDGKQAWSELQKMIANISPSGQASLNAVINIANSLGQQKNPGFDIRTDLFGNLNDDIITYQKPVPGNSLGELANPPTLFLFAVSNPDAFINAVRTLVTMSNPQSGDSAPREFLGRKIYSIPLKPAPAAPGAAPQPRALYAAASSGYAAFSTDSAIVEEFLRNADGKNQPLRENPGLVGALQHLGGAGGGLFSYENQRETMRVTFKAVKNTLDADSTLKMFPPSFREWFDFSLLPDYDLVSKYFFISTFAGSANADGLTFRVFAPRPPQLN
ncbi:MAG: hypothetical protein ABSH48_06475 [Verrucomicrobiota bacterium]|jgi:hypothetical protein